MPSVGLPESLIVGAFSRGSRFLRLYASSIHSINMPHREGHLAGLDGACEEFLRVRISGEYAPGGSGGSPPLPNCADWWLVFPMWHSAFAPDCSPDEGTYLSSPHEIEGGLLLPEELSSSSTWTFSKV